MVFTIKCLSERVFCTIKLVKEEVFRSVTLIQGYSPNCGKKNSSRSWKLESIVMCSHWNKSFNKKNSSTWKCYLFPSPFPRAVTESINQLITLCTQQAPGQKECDNALRELEVLLHSRKFCWRTMGPKCLFFSLFSLIGCCHCLLTWYLWQRF